MSASQLVAVLELQHQVCVLVHLTFSAALKIPAPPLSDLEFASKHLHAREPQLVDTVQALQKFNVAFKIQHRLQAQKVSTSQSCFQLQMPNVSRVQAIRTFLLEDGIQPVLSTLWDANL